MTSAASSAAPLLCRLKQIRQQLERRSISSWSPHPEMAAVSPAKRSDINRQIQNMKFAKVVAEPLPRRSPAGVTSGISQRVAGAVGAEAIRRICQHYVEKCSGRYTNNVMAARYVHQLADEVLIQLDSLREPTAAVDQTNATQPALTSRMEELLSEWNEYFPASLGKIGNPKAVAAKLKALEKEIVSLKEDNQTARKSHEALVADLQHQLQVSRAGILTERKNTGEELVRREQLLREAFDEERRKWESLLNVNESASHERLRRLERELTTRVSGAQNEVERLLKVVDRLREQNKRLTAKNKERATAVRALETLGVGDQLRHEHVVAIEDLNQRVEVGDFDQQSLSSPAASPSTTPSSTPHRKKLKDRGMPSIPRIQAKSMEEEYNAKIKTLQQKLDNLNELMQQESLKSSSLDSAYRESLAQIDFLNR